MEELKKIWEIVRSTARGLMESLIKGEFQALYETKESQRNGCYERDLETRYGKINYLMIL